MIHPDAQLLIARQITSERLADAERRRLVSAARRTRSDRPDEPHGSRRWARAPQFRPRQLAPC